uniref:Arginine/serine-rich protein 1 n=1 Tax=Jaculus jaculus TaxID=51337 RepID=A0A8C5JX00_JACJA|nr:arginine/serine-rich protein 1 [Jaculus jaculus]XP_045006681.1 arginine/serine-rich protein 1 [Jaculus jaculus]
MSNYVNDMWPGSPQEKDSPSTSGSGHSSRLSSRSRSSSRSTRSRSRSSGRSSRSRSRPRRSRRSRSRSRRRHQRFRRYSRSYSRSRSRSYSRSRRHRDGYYGRPRRYYQSPSPYRSRSRSRSRGRSHSRRSYYAITRGRRYYGFGRTVYPEEHGRWRARSRTRSRSRSATPFRLTEKDRMELLEIAKANAAKALGTTNLVLPASLQTVPAAKDTSRGAKSELSEKQTEDETRSPNEKLSQQRNIAFSSNNSVAKPIQKTANAEVTSSGSPKIDKKKSPYGLWIPV